MSALKPIRAYQIRPGDGLTFGDHTGWYRVRHVDVYWVPTGVGHKVAHVVTVRSWIRRRRTVSAASWVWVER